MAGSEDRPWSTGRRSRSRTFPGSTQTVPAARHWAKHVLAGWGLAAFDAELALNEMITNAILPGTGDKIPAMPLVNE